MQIELAKPEVPACIEESRAIVVSNPETYSAAAEMLKALKSAKERIEAYFEKSISDAHATHKGLCDMKAKALLPITEQDVKLRTNMAKYLEDEDRKKREAEMAARAKAQRDAEDERIRLLEEAVAAESDELLAEVDMVTAEIVNVEHAVQKTVQIEGGGSITRKTDIQVTVFDMKALCKEVAEGRVPVTVMETKPAMLKSWAKVNQVKSCPGLIIKEVSSVSVR